MSGLAGGEMDVPVPATTPRRAHHNKLRLSNLNCAACVARVEGALRAVPGVSAAHVNLATSLAQVEGTASLDELDAALRHAGYPVAYDTVALRVETMSCGSCVAHIEAALAELARPGSLHVNLANQTVRFEALSRADAAVAAQEALRFAGYGAHILSSRQDREGEQEALSAQARRVLWALVLSLPVFVSEMGGHLIPALHHAIAHSIGLGAVHGLQFLLSTALLLGPGREFFRLGFANLWRRTPDMNSLVALGAGAAYLYSTCVLFAPALFPEPARQVYFESTVVIVTLILIGRWMEARAKDRTGAALRHLLNLSPPLVRLVTTGQSAEVPLEQLQVGDLFQVRPGERIATDGIIREGASHVDESMITGEPLAVTKTPGCEVTGGTINDTGILVVEACKIGSETVLARIIDMVETAQAARLPVQELVTRITAIFVPAVLVIAWITIALWLVFGASVSYALVAGVSVLIIACPCAMGLATPSAIMVGTGRAAQLGILLRNGEALQRLQDVKLVAFDKTGTLTQGRPELVSIKTLSGVSQDEALRDAASVEQASEHPVARSLTAEAQARGLHLRKTTDFRARPGHGVEAQLEGQRIILGNWRMIEGLDLGQFGSVDRQSMVYMVRDDQVVARFTFADQVKPGSAVAVKTLRDQGMQVALISGDRAANAQAVAAELGIRTVEADLLPEQKVEALARLRARIGPVAFVGDGINDAPALAFADVGIAIGTGTDIAMETADVIVMSGDPARVSQAVVVSRATMRIIRQNLFWAFAYNVALIPVAAGALYPLTGALLSPALAAGAMTLSSVFVLGNALRLRRAAPEQL